jgi:hypothetical protein
MSIVLLKLLQQSFKLLKNVLTNVGPFYNVLSMLNIGNVFHRFVMCLQVNHFLHNN